MNNTEYRLQILSHSEIFANRVDAVDYVNDYFKPESLIGEPVVCFYGDPKKPSVLMAVGVGNRKIAFIDIDEVKEKVAELSEDVAKNTEIVEKISKSFMSIIDACGLVFDENKIENQITYVPDRKDVLINETKSISEAVGVISQYVQEEFANIKFIVEDSKAINLTFKKNDEGDGNILKATVKISTYGDSDEDAFNNNIIGVKNDGLYATSNLTYDDERHRLTFTSSGMKNGKFMDDANKQVIDLGGHPTYSTNNDGHNIELSIKETAKEQFEVSADAKLSDDVDNILVSRDGKLFVDGRAKNIKYKSSTVFKGLTDLEASVDTLNDKVSEIERNSVITGDESDTLVIKANKTSNGYSFTGDVRLSEDKSIVVANGGLKADIEITSDIAANKLRVRVGNVTKEVELPGVNIIKEVKYNPTTKTIYIVLNDGSSMNIPVGDMLKTWTVYNYSNSPVYLEKKEVGDIDQLSASLKLASTDNILEVDENGLLVARKSVITNAVDEETTRALAAETEIRAALKEETSKREDKEAELESKVLNNEKSVAELIAKDKAVDAALEEAVKEFNNKLSAEIERAMLAEQKNKDMIDILNSDADVPGSVEHVVSHAIADVKVLVNVEKERAVAVEKGLEERIVSLESKIGTDTESVLDMAKAYTDVETERAKTAEAVLEDKIETLTTYTYVDGKLALKADSAAVEEGLAKKADITSMNEGLAKKADLVETDYKLGLKADKESVYSKSEADAKFLKEHQDLSHLATKEEVALKLDVENFDYEMLKKANVGDSYLKSEADAMFLKEHQDLSHLATKEDASALSAKDAEIEAAYKAADATLQANIDKKVSDVKLEKGDSDLVYHLFVDGNKAGTINIPEDQFLSEVTYDSANGELVFVFSTSSGFNTVRVDIKSLIDTYTAGNGLMMEENEFSIKVSDADEGFIVVNENGIKTVGIKEALAAKANIGDSYTKAEMENILDGKANVGVSYTKDEADAKFLSEHQDLSHLATKEELKSESNRAIAKEAEIEAAYKAADEKLAAKIDTKVSEVKLEKGDTDLVYHLTVDGVRVGTINIPQDQFLKNVSYDAGNKRLVFVFSTSNGELTEFVSIADLVDTYSAGNGLSMSDNKFSVKVDTASENYLTVSESGIKISGIKAAIDAKANIGDSYLKSEADAMFLKEHQDISMLASKEEVSSLEASYKAADEAIVSEVKNKVSDVKLQKGDTDMVYHLFVDGNNAGTINIPQDQFLESASYDAGNKRMVFVFITENGKTTEYVDVADLVDTYSAGNGLKLSENQFSVVLNPASEGYITVDANGIKLSGIKAAIDAKANIGDSYLKSEADAMFLKEHQDISMLASKEEVKAESERAIAKESEIEALFNNKFAEIEAAYKAADDSLSLKDAELQTNIDAKVGEVKLEKGDTDLVYHLMVDGEKAGSISIPEDLFLKDVNYDEGNKRLVFVFKTESGEQTKYIDVADLVDTYTAGNGLSMTDNKFSVKVDSASESYLTVSADGIKLHGIVNALNMKANVGDSYTKEEADAKFLTQEQDISGLATKEELKAESNRAIAKESEIEAALGNKVEDIKLEKGDSDLVYHLTVDGERVGSINIPEDQLLKSASYDAGNKRLVFVFKTESGEQTEYVDVADLVDTYSAGEGLKIVDNKFSVVVNPASEEYLSVDANGIKVSGIKQALNAKANVGDSYLKSEADAMFLKEHQDLSHLATKEALIAEIERSVVKEGEIEAAYKAADEKLAAKVSEIEASYKAADTTLQANIDTKVSEVKLEKGDTDMVYHLFVDGEKAGSINIPQNQFLKNAYYDAGNKRIVFVFNTESGEQTEYVDVADLVDTYSAGNGLKLSENQFSVVVNPASESYITVDANGIKLSGIDAKFAEKANVGDSYTKAEADAMFLKEHQDISGLATKAEVSTKVETRDFEDALAKKAENGASYLKAESDEKFITKVDADAAYAKIAELKEVVGNVNTIATDLEELDNEVESLKFNVANSDTLMMSMNVVDGSKQIVGNVKISGIENNILKSDANGIFAKVSMDYNRATNVITFNNGNGEQTYQLSDHSLVSEGYYDSANKQIVLVVVKDGGAKENINIPVGDLVNTFEVKNDDNNSVRLEKTSVNGVDTLSAYVRVSNVASNLIESNNGTLYASKDAKDHTAVWTDGSSMTVQEAILKLGKEIENVELGDEFKETIDDLVVRFATVEDRVNITEGKITEVETRMTSLEENVANVLTHLEEIQKTIDNLIDFGTY